MSNSVAEILNWLMQRHEISEAGLARATGVTQPTIHRIVTGEIGDPRHGKLQPIANYFGISVAQLRGEEPSKDLPVPGQSYSLAERELIAQFRRLDEEEKRVIHRTVAALAQSRTTSGAP